MNTDLRESIINKLKAQFDDYSHSFSTFMASGHEIEDGLQSNTELLTEVRKRFDNLSATVELEFEGISVFEQEINKAKELLQSSIDKVHQSAMVSNQITQDLNNISSIFKKIHDQGVQLEQTIKNISDVADAIEVASRNAGITAFHAGRHGRGFEVIAREMTHLVRSSQEPARMIPECTENVIKGMAELDQDLKKIADIINYLNEISQKFEGIVNELLALIPMVENGIKGIAESVAAQKEMHNLLLRENQKLAQWLDRISETARSSLITQIFLEALFRHVKDIQDNLLHVRDLQNFYFIFRTFQTVLEDAARKILRIARDISQSTPEELETSSSDRLILQFVTETNHLLQTIGTIDREIRNWTKTNKLSGDVIARGINFYQDIVEMLIQLNRNLTELRATTQQIEPPLDALKRITERSRILGLYAGIESARGGEYAGPLAVVTKEIKNLSLQTSHFVNRMADIQTEIVKDFTQLSSYIIKSQSDVEQGVAYLQSAVACFNQNQKVLGDLGILAQEMTQSTQEMFDQCRNLGEQIKSFGDNYRKILREHTRYSESISTSAGLSEKILTAVRQQGPQIQLPRAGVKTMIYRELVDPLLLDPANKTDATSTMVLEQICTGLLGFNAANTIIPALADSFNVSRDGRIWDFFLKPGVKFHDGTAVTVQDVVFSLQRAKAGTNANFIEYVESITALADNRIRFVLKYPYIPFLNNLACGVCAVVPRYFTADHPVGCGPYRLTRWEKGRELTLEVYDEFYDSRPPIDRIVIKTIADPEEACQRFLDGEIDIVRLSSESTQRYPAEQLVSGPTLATYYLAINVTLDTPFKNPLVRQAVNLAIDRRQLISQLLNGRAVPAFGVFPPGLAAYDPEIARLYQYDLGRARELMAQAGYPRGLSGTFVLDSRDNQESVLRSRLVKELLEKIGIEVNVQTLNFNDFLEKGYRGEALLQIKGWISDNGDPDNFLYPLFHSRSRGRPGNTTFYANPEVDALIDQARAEPSPQRRNQLYRKIERTIIADAPVVFLYHPNDTYAVSNRVGGFKVDPFQIVRFRYLWC